MTSRSRQYNIKRKEKEILYNKYNINLISINPQIFNDPLEEVQENLMCIFQKYFKYGLLKIDNKYMINPNKLSDEEILSRFMEFSNDKRCLPMQNVLIEKVPTLFHEMLRRYGNQNIFAKHFHKLTYNKRWRWTKDFALNLFNDIHNKYGYLIRTSEIRVNSLAKKDSIFIGFKNGIQQVFGNVVDGYLYYYNYCIKNNIKLHKKDIEYLNDIINYHYFNKKTITKERRDAALRILSQI